MAAGKCIFTAFNVVITRFREKLSLKNINRINFSFVSLCFFYGKSEKWQMDPFFYTFLYSSTERALYKFWGGKAFRGFCPTFTRLYSAESNSISPKNVLGQTGRWSALSSELQCAFWIFTKHFMRCTDYSCRFYLRYSVSKTRIS